MSALRIWLAAAAADGLVTPLSGAAASARQRRQGAGVPRPARAMQCYQYNTAYSTILYSTATIQYLQYNARYNTIPTVHYSV